MREYFPTECFNQLVNRDYLEGCRTFGVAYALAGF